MGPEDLLDTNGLLNRARHGDERAVALLYRRYIRRVENWTHGRVPERARPMHDTRSVSHDILVRVLLKATVDGIELRSAFQAYVRGCVRNRLIDLSSLRATDFVAVNEELPHEAPNDLERLLADEFESLIRSRIDALPMESREILHLRFERELGYEEISDVLHHPTPDAARMRVNRVLEQLRDGLADGV